VLIWWGFCSIDWKKLINLILQKFEIRFRKIFGKKCWFPFSPVVPHLIGVHWGTIKLKEKILGRCWKLKILRILTREEFDVNE